MKPTSVKTASKREVKTKTSKKETIVEESHSTEIKPEKPFSFQKFVSHIQDDIAPTLLSINNIFNQREVDEHLQYVSL